MRSAAATLPHSSTLPRYTFPRPPGAGDAPCSAGEDAGKLALGLYLGKKATESTQSAAGALIVLLLWVYYSAQIVFFRAELTHALLP